MNALQQAASTQFVTLAALILDARLSAGLTQAEVAERIGVTQQSIAKWESGSAAPRGQHRDAVATLLGLNLGGAAVLSESFPIASQRPSIAEELLLAELIITTIIGLLPDPMRKTADEQLTKIGVSGADPLRSQERRAAIVAGGAA